MRTVTSKTILIIFFMLCSAWAGADVAQPSAYDVDSLRQEAYRVIEDFYEQSRSLRLKYDHATTFVSDEHKGKILGFAEKVDQKLKDIYDKQRQLRADIEACDSDDWDMLFGITGVWKGLYVSEFETQWLRKEIAYYIALASPPAERLEIADRIIGWCESDANRFKNAQTKLLKANASVLIGIDSKGYKQQAMKIIEELVASKDHDKVYFQAVLLRFDIVGDINRSLLAEMADEIAQSELSDDFELNAKVAFAGLKIGTTKYLDEVMTRWPGSDKVIAEIILESLDHLEKNGALSDRFLARQSVSEIRLALNTIMERSAANYVSLLERFDAVEKFRCSLLSYAMAESYADDSPVLAVEHYIAAATTRNVDKTVSITKLELANKGASLAANLYAKDDKYCGVACRALSFYCRTAGPQADAEKVNYYFDMLDECLGEDKATKQLQRLADSDGYFADVVRFHLAKRKIESEPTRQNFVNAVKGLADAEYHCGYLKNASAILYDICVHIEEYANEYPAFIDDCYFLANRFSDCNDDADRRLGFVKIELGVLAGDDVEQLSDELKTIDDGSLASLRCRARLMQAKGQYGAAAAMWKKLVTFNSDRFSYSWWQGKYYELWCVGQLPDTKGDEITHAVKVLQSSYENIPPFWAKKLGEL